MLDPFLNTEKMKEGANGSECEYDYIDVPTAKAQR